MAKLKAGLGSSKPITRSEELACPPKQSNSVVFNCLEKAEEALIIFDMIVVVFLPSRNPILYLSKLVTGVCKHQNILKGSATYSDFGLVYCGGLSKLIHVETIFLSFRWRLLLSQLLGMSDL